MPAQQPAAPTFEFTGTELRVHLPNVPLPPELPRDSGNMNLDVNCQLAHVYLVRIRRAISKQWSPAFVTPFANITFDALQPDTEYEVEVRAKNASGPGAPALHKFKTGPKGTPPSNVVPFSPRR